MDILYKTFKTKFPILFNIRVSDLDETLHTCTFNHPIYENIALQCIYLMFFCIFMIKISSLQNNFIYTFYQVRNWNQNMYITCSKLKKWTENIHETFLKLVLQFYENDEKLLLIDSWKGRTNPEMYNDFFVTREKNKYLKNYWVCGSAALYFHKQND